MYVAHEICIHSLSVSYLALTSGLTLVFPPEFVNPTVSGYVAISLPLSNRPHPPYVAGYCLSLLYLPPFNQVQSAQWKQNFGQQKSQRR